MARTVRDANLQTREARTRLKARPEPYYRVIEEGLHLGYRKPRSGAGKWVLRRYVGEQSYEVEVIAIADDLSDANDATVLSFDQAQKKAREIRDQRDRAKAGKCTGPFTAADAMDLYIEFLEGDDRSEDALADTRYRDKVHIRPALGHLEAASLTTEQLTKWRNGVAKAAPRLRTRPGEKQQYREVDGSEDGRRARRASARRIWTTLKAALNHAFRHDKVVSDAAWKKVKALPSVDKARVRYLTIAEANRLINASEPDFRPMVQAGFLTGARYGQLAKLTVGDFSADAGTLTLRSRKGRGGVRTYHAHLTAEAAAFFRAACARRNDPDNLIFKKESGEPWKKSDQIKPIKDASIRANISPPANFHIARHTWASHSVMAGMSLMVVAQNLGHSDTKMVELHYGHLAPGYRQNQVREFAPTFGIKPDVAVLPR
jgi:integrase